MKKNALIVFFALFSTHSFSQNIRLITQFINPCGNDGSNEFIVGLATTAVNVGDMGFASINHMSAGIQPDFNWYWYGKNVINAPKPTFTPNAENCGVSGSGLSCFRIMDPGTPADATVIDNVRNTLNTIAGCNVFVAVPATGIIPGGLFTVFLGAGGCGLDVPATNLNFSNHCSGGSPTQQYYLVVGNGAYTPLSGCNGGYFVNSNGSSRTSTIYDYTGGGNTLVANYQSSSAVYTNGGSPAAGNAAVIVPNGAGGSVWINNSGCVPSPMVILDEKTFSVTGFKQVQDLVTLNWKLVSSAAYDYFALERSFNGINFTELKVEKTVQQNSSEYSGAFSDENARSPLLYYRVKAVAMDGKIAYSSLKVVNNLGQQRITIFPNPSRDQFTIKLTGMEPVSIAVADIAGREVLRKQMSTSVMQVDVSSWAPGFYTIRISNAAGQFIQTQKFIKQ
ncbi:MAG: T9SS type A sorting domain-containing protein [Sphingobacteriales bacterium]|nr:T9SS type A sorting domain-containing protein [Sphingobacteriales bacterium]